MIRTASAVLSRLLGSRKVQTAVAAIAGTVALQLLTRIHSELADEADDLENRAEKRLAEIASAQLVLEQARAEAARLRRQIERAYAAGVVQAEAEKEAERVVGVGIQVTEPGARARFVEVTEPPAAGVTQQ